MGLGRGMGRVVEALLGVVVLRDDRLELGLHPVALDWTCVLLDPSVKDFGLARAPLVLEFVDEELRKAASNRGP